MNNKRVKDERRASMEGQRTELKRIAVKGGIDILRGQLDGFQYDNLLGLRPFCSKLSYFDVWTISSVNDFLSVLGFN